MIVVTILGNMDNEENKDIDLNKKWFIEGDAKKGRHMFGIVF